jgi:pyruvate kinase
MGERTKIVATIGPASSDDEVLRALIAAGLDVVRLNFSHGDAAQHRANVALVRRLEAAFGRPVGILADLQGPKIRTGGLPGGPFVLAKGAPVTLASGAGPGDATRIPIRYNDLDRELQEGDRVLFGDGELELRVDAVAEDGVRATVIEGGPVKENQGVNSPRLGRDAPSLTPKDEVDAALAVELGVDYLGLSFVRSARDLLRLRDLLLSRGAAIPVIAKIEKQEALDNLDAILEVADGVMVARGDLGLELPLEQVPLAQKRIIRRANEQGRLVITATQMLESMISNPRPTRAEVSDVANAILDGTDAVMLSGETSIGGYPEGAVRTMARIAKEMDRSGAALAAQPAVATRDGAMARAACDLARDVKAEAVVVFTRTGHSARLVSNERPPAPIYAFTPDPSIARRLTPWWGVQSLLAEWPPDAAAMLATADRILLERGLAARGATIVVARWATTRAGDWTNFVHLHPVGGAGDPLTTVDDLPTGP